MCAWRRVCYTYSFGFESTLCKSHRSPSFLTQDKIPTILSVEFEIMTQNSGKGEYVVYKSHGLLNRLLNQWLLCIVTLLFI